MINRPFSLTNINVFNEKTRNMTPTTLCGQNVLISEEQHRKMVDTFTTSIAANPGFSSPATQQIGNHPNTVTFTFNGSQPYYQQPYNFSWQSSGPAMSGLNQLQHRNALDLLQLQQQLNSSQPYQLKFHLDNQTSTTDLSADSKTRADLKNLAGLLMSRWPYWLQTPTTRTNPKKLILKNVTTAKVEGSILDDIDSPKSKDKKKVNFAESQATAAQNAEVQVHMCCNCCKREEKKYRCSRKKKGKVRKKDSDETSSDISTEEDIR